MRWLFKIARANFFIALLITVLLYVFYPPVSLYRWEVKNLSEDENSVDFFVDIDNNGSSELLKISDNKGVFSSLSLYDQNELLLSHLNLTYQTYAIRGESLIIDDINGNGLPEIFFLGVKKDTLYLLQAEYSNGSFSKPSIDAFPLDLIKQFDDKYHFISNLDVADLNNDGEKELLIMITSGYALMPRRVYKVSPVKNEVLRSPVHGAGLTGFVVDDIDGDEVQEIVLHTEAYCNIYEQTLDKIIPNSGLHDSIVLANKEVLLENSDCKTWLIVLDDNLRYKFKPLSWGTWTGKLVTYPFPYQGQRALFSLYSNYRDSLDAPVLFIHDAKGKLLFEKVYNNASDIKKPLILNTCEYRGRQDIYIADKYSNRFDLDKNFDIIRNSKNEYLSKKHQLLTTNIDNKDLILFIQDETLKILDSDLNPETSVSYLGIDDSFFYTSISSYSETEDLIMVDMGRFKVRLVLSKNPFHTYAIFIWLGTFLSIWLVSLLVQKIYSYRVIRDKLKLQKIVDERTEEIEQQNRNLEKLADDLKEKSRREAQQKLELEKRKSEIESLYNKLTSNVIYSKGIKGALLPSDKDLANKFTDAFVFFRPKNVVGGDFYWISSFENKKVVVLGDAFGEGISGGFLSLLVISLLNQYRFTQDTKASDLLKVINRTLYKHLLEYYKNNEEGIKMAVLVLEDVKDMVKLQFASANIPLYYFSSHTILNMKGIEPNDYSVRSDVYNQSFRDVDIELPKGSMIYMFTKGLYNQIGGDKKERFGDVELCTCLHRINVLKKEEQQSILTDKFDNWQQANEQTDDVLCMGLRV